MTRPDSDPDPSKAPPIPPNGPISQEIRDNSGQAVNFGTVNAPVTVNQTGQTAKEPPPEMWLHPRGGIVTGSNWSLLRAEAAAKADADRVYATGWGYHGVGHVALKGYLLCAGLDEQGYYYWWHKAGAEALASELAGREAAYAFIEEYGPEQAWVHHPSETLEGTR